MDAINSQHIYRCNICQAYKPTERYHRFNWAFPFSNPVINICHHSLKVWLRYLLAFYPLIIQFKYFILIISLIWLISLSVALKGWIKIQMTPYHYFQGNENGFFNHPGVQLSMPHYWSISSWHWIFMCFEDWRSLHSFTSVPSGR